MFRCHGIVYEKSWSSGVTRAYRHGLCGFRLCDNTHAESTAANVGAAARSAGHSSEPDQRRDLSGSVRLPGKRTLYPFVRGSARPQYRRYHHRCAQRKDQCKQETGSNAQRAGEIGLSVPSFLGLPFKSIFQDLDLEATSSNKFDGKGESSSNNNFTGTIAVTVLDILPNGNLLVSGEKQIGINQGHEFIRLSGVINPINIINNTVSSIQVADARIEYRGNGYLDEVQTMGWLSRFFLSISPF